MAQPFLDDLHCRPAAPRPSRSRPPATATATAPTPPRRPPATSWPRARSSASTGARITGVAPGAWVIVYKVCGIEGCFSSDSAAAVEQAILDGVDVINFSISGGTDPFTDPVELAFLDAYAAGVFVAASAGNSGPGAATTDHLSPWVTTVAASTQTPGVRLARSPLTGRQRRPSPVDGVSITAGVGPAAGRPGRRPPPYSRRAAATSAAPRRASSPA